MASKELVITATKTIRAGSKSFSAAGLLLPKEAREGAYLLYSWCRYTDDMADEDTPSLDRETAIDAFEYIFDRYEIPSHYARELQAGMEMDNKGIEYETLDGDEIKIIVEGGTLVRKDAEDTPINQKPKRKSRTGLPGTGRPKKPGSEPA